MGQGLFQVPLPYNEPIYAYEPGSPERTKIMAAIEDLKSNKQVITSVIHGKRITSSHTEKIQSPHQHDLNLGELHMTDRAGVQSAVDSCLEARKSWAKLPWQERAAVFLKAADLLTTKYRYKTNAATMLAQSKTVYQSEIDAVCELADFFRFNVEYMKQLHEQEMISPNGQWNRLTMRGLEGFVYAIGPFNFTSISLNLCCAPALMGCSVLWKPAATAAYSSYLLYEVLEEAGLPPGVINMVIAPPADVSDVALKHPELTGIHFTGSTKTFNYLWAEVGKNINTYKHYPRLVGETGGKDFVFSYKDSCDDQLVTALVRGAFEYQGQKCSAASRAYIPKSQWERIKPRVVEITNGLSMGNVEDLTHFMAAVIDQRAYDKITGYIKEAKSAKDADVIAGGDFSDKEGFFVRPTIIETSNSRYNTMCEEIFGPVLTVHPYDDEQWREMAQDCDEATPYALTGAIFAKDRSIVSELGDILEHAAGNFYINDKPTGAVVGQQPFGGARASGTNDKAGSIYNLVRWASMRTMKETFVDMHDHRYPHMDS